MTGLLRARAFRLRRRNRQQVVYLRYVSPAAKQPRPG